MEPFLYRSYSRIQPAIYKSDSCQTLTPERKFHEVAKLTIVLVL